MQLKMPLPAEVFFFWYTDIWSALHKGTSFMQYLFSTIGRMLSRLYARILLITVVCHTPDTHKGATIYVCNHPSTLDPFYLLGIFQKKVSILITEHVFHVPVIGYLVKRAGHIPVTLHDGKTYAAAKQTLLEGNSVVVFAEGEISYGARKLRRFRTGAVRLAMETGAPIVSIGIHLESQKIWRKKLYIKKFPLVFSWYRYGWYSVFFGKPTFVYGTVSNRRLVRKETVLLRKSVLSCIEGAHLFTIQDRIVHARKIKMGFHGGLRKAYRIACFIGFLFFKMNEFGGKLVG